MNMGRHKRQEKLIQGCNMKSFPIKHHPQINFPNRPQCKTMKSDNNRKEGFGEGLERVDNINKLWHWDLVPWYQKL